MSKCNFLNAKKKILHINCINFLFLFYGNIISQYRDPFSEKKEDPQLKKTIIWGCFIQKHLLKGKMIRLQIIRGKKWDYWN